MGRNLASNLTQKENEQLLISKIEIVASKYFRFKLHKVYSSIFTSAGMSSLVVCLENIVLGFNSLATQLIKLNDNYTNNRR